MVFASPNKAQTTKNSSNTRSELRYMLRGKDTRIKTHSAANNFADAAELGVSKFEYKKPAFVRRVFYWVKFAESSLC